ncbi:MAG: hypothetical protein H6626_07615 [Pseudobdellovibrionaceae bacterium]|nr:hypothetical protein [Bdellovibrionales bacterium]USN46095.1 MAG: hypothetical protein H6626_07615 [Pseudobdellovibrionaceae bacterium]
MKIRLVEIGGEFCTSRRSPALEKLRALTKECLDKGEYLEILTEGVKILTPSFIDEWIPPLIIEYGEETYQKFIRFEPALEGYLKEQVQRGVAARLP